MMLVIDGPNDKMHHSSAIPSKSSIENREDLGEVTILCSIGPFNIKLALCELGATINLMLLVVFK